MSSKKLDLLYIFSSEKYGNQLQNKQLLGFENTNFNLQFAFVFAHTFNEESYIWNILPSLNQIPSDTKECIYITSRVFYITSESSQNN